MIRAGRADRAAIRRLLLPGMIHGTLLCKVKTSFNASV
jgi:hypothetical protein